MAEMETQCGKKSKKKEARVAPLCFDVTETNYCGDCVLELELELSLLLPVLELSELVELPELELFCGELPWPTLLVSNEPP